MINMKTDLFLKLFALLIMLTAGSLYPRGDEEIKMEYQSLQKELEKSEENYFKTKYALIEQTQKGKEKTDYLEDEYNEFVKTRAYIKDDVLRIKAELNTVNEEAQNYKRRINEIYLSYNKILEKLQDYIYKNQPFTDPQDTTELNKIQKVIEQKENFIYAGRMIIDFIDKRLAEAGETAITHLEILDQNDKPVRAKKIRVGNIFYGYVTVDNNESAILLRNNKPGKKVFDWYYDISSDAKKQINKALEYLREEPSAKDYDKNRKLSLPVDVMQSGAVGKVYSERTGILGQIINWFQGGGIVMYGIILVFIYAIYLIVNKIINYRKNHHNAEVLMNQIVNKIKNRNIDAVLDFCEHQKGPLPRMLKEVFKEKTVSREEAHNKLHEVLLHESPVIEKDLPTLKSLAAVAPLLGLLGTVTGMISLFDVITIFGTGDPRMLAGGIGEALITTQFGLLIAIPIFLMHRVLLNIADHIINDMERYGLTVLNLYWREE